MAVTDDSTALAGRLQQLVLDVLLHLGDYPENEVDPAAVTRFRESLTLDADSLSVSAGNLVELSWWLDTCDDDVVDQDVAAKLLESVGELTYTLSEDEAQRLIEVLTELAAAEPHPGRREQLLFLPIAIGLVEDDGDDAPDPSTPWLPPADRDPAH